MTMKGTIRVKSYVRQAPIRVVRMGKPAEKVNLQSLQMSRFDRFMGRFEVLFRKAVLVAVLGFVASMAWYVMKEKVAYAFASPAILEVPYESKQMPPVLQRICQAESGGLHEKNGKVVTHKNKDGTIDVGVCQINSIHFKAAKKLGFDVYKEADNKAFARYLFFTQGSVPWRASCCTKNGWLQ